MSADISLSILIRASQEHLDAIADALALQDAERLSAAVSALVHELAAHPSAAPMLSTLVDKGLGVDFAAHSAARLLQGLLEMPTMHERAMFSQRLELELEQLFGQQEAGAVSDQLKLRDAPGSPDAGTHVSITTQHVADGATGVRIATDEALQENARTSDQTTHDRPLHTMVVAESISVAGGAGVAVHAASATVVTRIQSSPEHRAKLLTLVGIMRNQWIRGVLERPLQAKGATLIPLRMELKPIAVMSPWRQPPRNGYALLSNALPDGSISAAYAQHGPTLLLLGQPGAGKTTTLLQLAEALLTTAAGDESRPVPVVLSLSTWKPGDSKLSDWVCRELRQLHSVPTQLTRQWLSTQQLLLMLDGLDEVRSDVRSKCVSAVNEYAETAGLSGLVVSCRSEDYAELPERLRLYAAIEILPLSAAQSAVIARSGGMEASDWDAVQRSPAWAPLVQSPLVLSVASQVMGAGAHLVDDTKNLDRDDMVRRVMETYVDTMLQTRGHTWATETQSRFRKVMGQLALCMRNHCEGMFSIEKLQPSWLPSFKDTQRYLLATRTLSIVGAWVLYNCFYYFEPMADARLDTAVNRAAGAMSSFFLVLIPALLLSVRVTQRAWFAPEGARRGSVLKICLWGLSFAPGVLPAALRAVQSGSRSDIRLTEVHVWSWSEWRRRITSWAGLLGFGCGLFMSLLIICMGVFPETFTFMESLPQRLAGPVEWWVFTLIGVGAIAGLTLIALLTGLIIQQLRKLRSRLLAVLSGIAVLTLAGLASGMTLSETQLDGDSPLLVAMIVPGLALMFSLWAMLMLAPFVGLTTAKFSQSSRSGDGLRRARRISLWILIGMAGLILLTNLLVLSRGVPSSPSSIALGTVAVSLSGWLLAVAFGLLLWCGGFDLCSHFVLRRMLERRAVLPGDIQQFLDCATDATILQRVGGNYRFAHEYIQEVFLDSSRKPDESAAADIIASSRDAHTDADQRDETRSRAQDGL